MTGFMQAYSMFRLLLLGLARTTVQDLANKFCELKFGREGSWLPAFGPLAANENQVGSVF
jgi:hypothetical protein